MEETEGGQVRAISVSLEIRRFQEEINKVQAENCQFYQWKLRRGASRPSLGPSLPPRGISGSLARSQESLLAAPPGRPPRKNHKKVSYCEAVTVFGSSESLGRSAVWQQYNILCPPLFSISEIGIETLLLVGWWHWWYSRSVSCHVISCHVIKTYNVCLNNYRFIPSMLKYFLFLFEIFSDC